MPILPNLELIFCTTPWVILLGDTRGLYYKVRALINSAWSHNRHWTWHTSQTMTPACLPSTLKRGFNSGKLCNWLRAAIGSAKNVVVNAGNWRSARVHVAGLAEGSSCGDSSCSIHALSPSESRADPITMISLPWWRSISPTSHLSVVICLYLGSCPCYSPAPRWTGFNLLR